MLKCENYDDKVNLLMDNLPPVSKYTKSYQRIIARSIYKRLIAILNYMPSFSKIRSEVHLYKPTIRIMHNIDDDYGLSKYCYRDLIIQTLDGDHNSILDNDELAVNIDNLFENKTSDKVKIIEMNRPNGVLHQIQH